MTEPGDRLGSHYILDRALGSGAMGQVWLAHDEDGGDVAVKMLHPHLTSDKSIVRRFIEERQLLTSIHSPAVVEVFDMVMEGDKLGIVMEYVDGPDLGSELKIHTGRHELMQEGYAARLGAEICDGLAAVHAARICHRDVKPANVLLSHGPDGGWHPKLTDFGVSKILDSSLEGTTGFAGTPNYVAPEIIRGQTPSPASDFYSFGVMLYEMVAGRTPFTAPNREAVLLAHLDREPQRPAEIGDAMWYVISCCMTKDAAGRPASAAGVAAGLRRVAEGLDPGVLVSPASTGGWPGPGADVAPEPTYRPGQGWMAAPTRQLSPAEPSPTSQYPSVPPPQFADRYGPASYPASYPASGPWSPGSIPPGSAGTVTDAPSVPSVGARMGGSRMNGSRMGGSPAISSQPGRMVPPARAGRRRARIWIPVLVVLLAALVVVGVALDPFGWKGNTAGGSPSGAGSASSGAQPAQSVTLPAGAKVCGPKVGVGTQNTSCELAANVAAAIPSDPGDRFTVTAYSPVTGKSYTLTCTSGRYYTCVKEQNNIEVYVIR